MNPHPSTHAPDGRLLTAEEAAEKYVQAQRLEILFQSVSQTERDRLEAKYPTVIPEIEAVLGRKFVRVA